MNVVYLPAQDLPVPSVERTPASSLLADVTVGPQVNTYKLMDLKSGTMYQVQIAGLTRAGSGELSAPCLFKTNHQGSVRAGVRVNKYHDAHSRCVFSDRCS